MSTTIQSLLIHQAMLEETVLCELLGNWVSECDFCVICIEKSGKILGLGLWEDDSIKPQIIVPLKKIPNWLYTEYNAYMNSLEELLSWHITKS
jgi:hypothetical protein